MKVLKYFAVPAMALTLFASCNKNEPNATTNDGPKDLMVSLSLGNEMRAAISATTDKIANDAAASVENVDIYLVDAANKVITSKRFSNAELTKLIDGGGFAAGKGYKFLDVNANVTKVITIVNPQSTAVIAEGTALTASNLGLDLKVAANEAVYYNVSPLASATQVEPFGPESHDETGRQVIAMNIKAEGIMNRFQVEDVDFVVIKFRSDDVKAEYNEALGAFVAAQVEAGKTKEEAVKAFATDAAGMNGSTYKNPNVKVGFGDKTKSWSYFFKVENVTADCKQVFMNRFYDRYTLSLANGTFGTYSSLRQIAKHSDGYTLTNGTLKFGTDATAVDRSAVASYYVAGGLGAATANNKVAAFNFFAKQDGSEKLIYAKLTDSDPNVTAPKLHFYLSGNKVSAVSRFVNIEGYLQTASSAALVKDDMAKGAQLLTINIRNAGAGPNVDGDGDGNPDGPVVDSEDPTDPGVGKPDVTDDGKKNLAVHVTVTPWTENTVKPVF